MHALVELLLAGRPCRLVWLDLLNYLLTYRPGSTYQPKTRRQLADVWLFGVPDLRKDWALQCYTSKKVEHPESQTRKSTFKLAKMAGAIPRPVHGERRNSSTGARYFVRSTEFPPSA